MRKIRIFSPRILALAFATNRLDHCDREISPWLDSKNGNIVICDRYYLSSIVYQSSEDFPFESVYELNENARKPDIIFFLNVSNKVCYERMKHRNEAKELFEKNLSDTRQKFLDAISFLRSSNSENIVEIDASGAIEEVAHNILEVIYENYPSFIPYQPLLSRNLVQQSRVTTLNGHTNYRFEDAIDEFGVKLNNLFENQTNKSILSNLENMIDSLEFNKLGALFLDYIKKRGIFVKEKLPWTELACIRLESIKCLVIYYIKRCWINYPRKTEV
jgi:dTMP kinase